MESEEEIPCDIYELEREFNIALYKAMMAQIKALEVAIPLIKAYREKLRAD